MKPLRDNKPDIAERYKTILTSSKGIEIININIAIASKAAELRADHNLKTPDAIQLATTIEFDAYFFLTNDVQLNNIKGIRTLILQELN